MTLRSSPSVSAIPLDLLLTAACGTPGGAPPPPVDAIERVTLPDSAEGRQMAWVLAAVNERRALADDEIRTHFSEAFLAQVNPDQIRQVFASMAGLAPLTPTRVEPENGLVVHVVGASQGVRIQLAVDGREAIVGLLFTPEGAP